MKHREEPSNDSTRGEWSARQTDSVSRPGRTGSASFEQPALDRHSAVSVSFPEMLMEAVVSRSNMERAWKQVRSNRGAPGPDGITVDEFIAWARSYDFASAPVRSLDLHQRWMRQLECPIVTLDSIAPVAELCETVLNHATG